ncbi:MAG TPA: helix-turn-helix domain-containing protein [Pseudonocardiaceae bacterium]|jgi:AcrR family transcriptional regulator|nr:helix-turn-helix domain-containing protein [Pseudonocardiaceae bacterium]
MDELAPGDVSGVPVTLPRGPHRLTEEQVAESQCTRLMSALTDLMAERGYAAVTIGDLVGRAGVSRTSFYQHFAGKQECLFAAYDRFAAIIAVAITPDFDPAEPWRRHVEAILAGYLGALSRDLTATRAFLLEMDTAGRAARERRWVAARGFATMLAARHAEIRTRHPGLGPLPHRAYLGVALAARDLVCEALEREPEPDLHEIAPDLATIATALFEGAAAAST